MDYEKQLREYIESLLKRPSWSIFKEWAFGAVDFAYTAGLISLSVRGMLQVEYKLLEN